MMRLRVLPLLLMVSVGLASCDKKSSPTSPTTPTPNTATRIISLSPGDLAFGNVDMGSSLTKTFTINNSGNGPLTFTGMTAQGGTGVDGFAATPTSGTVPAGGSTTVSLKFSPTAAKAYSHVLRVTGDQTSGNDGMNVSGVGINNTPLFSKSGNGDTSSVGTAASFTLPSSVAKVRATASTTSSCENFAVYLSGKLLINVIIGTCSVADFRSLDAVFNTTGGGTMEVRFAGGQTSWTFTEVR